MLGPAGQSHVDGANPFVADLATSPFGRPPCRVGQVGGGRSLTLDAF